MKKRDERKEEKRDLGAECWGAQHLQHRRRKGECGERLKSDKRCEPGGNIVVKLGRKGFEEAERYMQRQVLQRRLHNLDWKVSNQIWPLGSHSYISKIAVGGGRGIRISS